MENIWEEYKIVILADPKDSEETDCMDLTQNLEEELQKLLKKYQGKFGMKITLSNTLGEIE